MTRRSLAGCALVLVALVALALGRVPLLVQWHAHGLASTDPNVRARARAGLLALGRPAIDPVYAELIAQEVLEESTGTSAIVVVARRQPALVRQRDPDDCGPAVLASLAAHHGLIVSLDAAARLASTANTGTNLFNLSKGAEKLGFEAKCARLQAGAEPLSVLKNCPVPFVAHYDADERGNGRYVLVTRVTSDEIELADPAAGVKRVPLAEFLARWSKHLMLAVPTDEFHRNAEHVRGYLVVEGIADAPAGEGELLAWGPLVCPTASKLWRDDATLELAVLVRRKDGTLELRLAVPLEEAERARLVAAVRARLARPAR